MADLTPTLMAQVDLADQEDLTASEVWVLHSQEAVPPDGLLTPLEVVS
jgi:hypothetical protein